MIYEGDCLEVMPTLEAGSVDAVVTDPPYNLTDMGRSLQVTANLTRKDRGPNQRRMSGGFMGKSWDGTGIAFRPETWAAMLRLAKPSAYLLAFGGTRTVHRMTCAIEDAGWVVRDMLVWAYASGFPKSKASLKPAWEPIVMARKPGPLRELAIDACRIAMTPDDAANVILTDPIFDGGWDGVVGGGEQQTHAGTYQNDSQGGWFGANPKAGTTVSDGDSGTYSRFFLIPKADRAEREPLYSDLPERVVWGGDEDDLTPGKKSTIGRRNTHPTVKPLELMRHLVRLVTPTDGLILDPFLGSGTTAIAAEMEGFRWTGIEREPEYVAIAEARLHGTQRGMGLPA